LLELLIVVGIIATLLVLMAPAFTTIKGGNDVTSAAYTIKGVLDTARTYAKANNTYTWVGFAEVDSSIDPSVSPQVTTGPAPYGRVAIAIVASKDGTRGYDITSNPLSIPSAWTNYNNGANLVAVGKLQYLNNVHLAGALTTTGSMARPNVSSNNYIIGLAPNSVTPFDWPLGSVLGTGQYSFKKVINFDPQGAARIQYSTNTDTISPYTEVGLQQTHGTTVDANSPQVSAFHMLSMCQENPSPSWNESHADWNLNDPLSSTPLLDGFVWTAAHDARSLGFFDGDGKRAMSYYDGSDLPYYYFLASNFATSDRWFAPTMSRTQPNRMYMLAATSAGHVYPPPRAVRR